MRTLLRRKLRSHRPGAFARLAKPPRALAPGLVILAALAALVRGPAGHLEASRMAGIAGQGATGIQVTNMDPNASASVTIDFYGAGGGAPVTRELPALAPLTAYSVYLPAEAGLGNGAYSAVIEADREISTLTRTSWPTSGASITHGDAATSTALLVPWVTKGYSGQTTILVVQNTDTSADASATIDMMASGSSSPAASTTVTIRAGGSATIDIGKFPGFAGLANGFLGWARVSASVPLAAVAITDIETSVSGAYAVEAIPAGEAATQWVAPLVANNYGSVSGINVLNPGDSPVEVAVRYMGISGDCAGLAIDHDTATVGAGANAVFYQGDILIPGTGRSHLPEGCSATARITASGPIAALVVLSDLSEGTVAAYPALRPAQAAERLLLPLLRRNIVGNSAIQVFNPSSETATVTLEYANALGGQDPYVSCGSLCEVTIPPGRGHRWELSLLQSIPNQSYGSGRILSDQPVLATVVERPSLNAAGERQGTDATFNAIAIPASSPTAPSRRHVPLALKSAGDPPPSRTPGTPPPTQPTATPDTIRGGGMAGAGTSGFQVMNLSRTEPADITVSFQPYRGGAPMVFLRNNVAPGAAANIYLPVEAQLSNGAYAARISANQPIGAIGRTDWTASGGAVIANASGAATELLIPWVTHNYSQQTSVIGIHNIDPASATTVRLEILRNSPTSPVATVSVELAAGGATLVDLNDHPGLDGLPDDFAGWARLSASRPIAASSFINVRGSAKGVYEIAAVPVDQAAARLSAPMALNDAALALSGSNHATTGISVLNPGSDPVSVSVRYLGSATGGPSNACAGQTIDHNGGVAVTIPAGSIQVFYQGDTAIPNSGRSGLPANCYASAVIEATGGGVLAVVNVASVNQNTSGAYAAVADAQGAERVHLPMVRREHTSGRLTTAIMAQNLGPDTAEVTLTLRDNRGVAIDCGSDCSAMIPPGGSRLWWPPAIAAWPANSYGSAQIDSDQPIAAAVDDLSLTSFHDQGVYLGIPEQGLREASLPLLLQSARIGSAPTPAPTNPPPTAGTPPTTGPRPPTGTPVPGGVLGIAGVSGIMVTNLSSSDAADITVDFRSQTGGPAVSVTKAGIAAGDTAYIYLPAEPSLGSDVYSALVRADQPVGIAARTDWTSSGHALVYNAPQAAADLVIPFLLKDVVGQTSIVSIQNTNAQRATTARLDVMRDGETVASASILLPLEGGAGTTLSLATHPALAGLPGGTRDGIFWGRVTATEPVAVQSTISGLGPKMVYEVPGIPAAAASSSLHLPMLAKRYALNPNDAGAGAITTGVTMLNPGPNPVTARIRYYGADTPGRAHACQGRSYDAIPNLSLDLAPGQILAFYQGHSGLPENCALSGVIETTGGGIVALVQATNQDLDTGFAYEPFSSGQGAQQVHLPLFRSRHTSSQLTTPIQVQNLGTTAATVRLELEDLSGAPVTGCDVCTATIPPDGSRLWWPSDIAAFPQGSYGSARVISDQPVAVVAADLSESGTGIDMAAYRGLTDEGTVSKALPVILRIARLGDVEPITGPTPTPSPAPPLAGLPSRMPTPVEGRISVPLSFDSGGYAVAELELGLDYDQSWLSFDDRDGDGNGLPDGIEVRLPEDFVVDVDHDPNRNSEELSIRVTAAGGTQSTLPNGSWLTIHLQVLRQPEPGAGGLAFAAGKGIRARDPGGVEIPSRMSGGWSVTSERVAYLPALFKP